MADKYNRHRLNATGKYYCTSEENAEGCLPCGLCYNQLPEVFTEDDEGFAYVYQQPDELFTEAVEEIIRDCPANSIGADG